MFDTLLGACKSIKDDIFSSPVRNMTSSNYPDLLPEEDGSKGCASSARCETPRPPALMARSPPASMAPCCKFGSAISVQPVKIPAEPVAPGKDRKLRLSADSPAWTPEKEKEGRLDNVRCDQLRDALLKENQQLEEEVRRSQVKQEKLERMLEKRKESLQAQKEKNRNEMDRLVQERDSALQERTETQDRMDNLTQQFVQLEASTSETMAALAEIRQFVSVADAGDANYLVQKVDDFNAKIDDFAFRLSDDLSQALPHTHFHLLEQYIPLEIRPAVVRALYVPLARAVTLDEVTMVVTKLFLHHSIDWAIWRRFLWIDSPGDVVLGQFYDSLRRSEPQALHARWRALTCAEVFRKVQVGEHATKAATHIFRTLQPFYVQVRALTPHPRPAGMSITLMADLEKIMNDALELQKIVRQEYLSSNYEVCASLPLFILDPTWMDHAEKYDDPRPRPRELVIGTVGVGLVKKIYAIEGKEGKTETAEYVKKVEVLTTRWLEPQQ